MPSFVKCSIPECDFTCDLEQDPNGLKTHKSRLHRESVTVKLSNGEQLTITRENQVFCCPRCSYFNAYPNRIQVRLHFQINPYKSLTYFIQDHTRRCQGIQTVTLAPNNPFPETSPTLKATLASANPFPETSPTPPRDIPSPLPLQTVPPSSSRSMTSSPVQLPLIFNSQYRPLPHAQTIVHHPPYDLPSLGISIDLRLRCIICLNAGRAVDCSKLIAHLRQQLPLIEVNPELPDVLQSAYNLVPYRSIVPSPGPITPVFGLPFHETPLLFCSCGKGYSTHDSLRSHQTKTDFRQCLLRDENPKYHMGYGQQLTKAQSFFEVDPDSCRLASEDYERYNVVYTQTLPPIRDYSNLDIQGAEDEMNTSSFFYSQRWLEHLKGYTPQDILEVYGQATEEVPSDELLLRQVGLDYLMSSTKEINKHNSFGLLKLMGQTTE
jgi:hypothetical protein